MLLYASKQELQMQIDYIHIDRLFVQLNNYKDFLIERPHTKIIISYINIFLWIPGVKEKLLISGP